MSASTPPSAGVFAAIAMCCPTCDALFDDGADNYPQIASCGHSICFACASAMASLAPPMCLVCKAVISDIFTPNDVLALFCTENVRECGDDSTSSATFPTLADISVSVDSGSTLIPEQIMHSSEGIDAASSVGGESVETCEGVPPPDAPSAHLMILAAQCTAGAANAMMYHSTVESARARMISRKEASVVSLHADVAAMKAAIDAHVAELVAQANKELNMRLKALDAQLDALTVTAGQLSSAAMLCERACRSTDATTAACARDSANRACAMIRPFKGPCVSTMVEIVSNAQRALPLAVSTARLRLGVNTDSTRVQGAGVSTYRAHEENTFLLKVRDDFNVPVTSLEAEDVVLSFQLLPVAPAADSGCYLDETGAYVDHHRAPLALTNFPHAGAQLTTLPPAALSEPDDRPTIIPAAVSVEKTANDELVVRYVLSAGVGNVLVRASVAGCGGVAGSPWPVLQLWKSCAASGKPVRKLLLAETEAVIGFAVSPSERWIAMSTHNQRSGFMYNSVGGSIAVVDAVTGRLVNRIPSLPLTRSGTMYKRSAGLCFTPAGHLLAVETGGAVRELSVPYGKELRRFKIDFMEAPHSICCSEEVVVVGAVLERKHSLAVFDYASGELLRTFPHPPGNDFGCSSMQLIPNTHHVVVAELRSPILTVVSLDDGSVVIRYACPDNGPKQWSYSTHVAVCRDGRIVAASGTSSSVHVFENDCTQDFVAWQGDGVGDGDGASAVPFESVAGLCIAGEHVYVLDTGSHCCVWVCE